MKTRFLSALTLAALILSLFASCSDGKDSEKEDAAVSSGGKVSEKEDAAVRAAFDEAYTVATLFSGYAANVYADGSIEVEYDDEYRSTLQYDRFSLCGTLAELGEMVELYFSDEIGSDLMAMEVMPNAPLYLEKDGVLYRFGGFVSLYVVDTEYIEVVSVTKDGDTFTVSVKAEYPDFYGEELATVTHDYTCERVGSTYKFTGEFPLLADIARDEILDDRMVPPLG